VVAIRANLEENDPDWLVSQHMLARAYIANGRIKEAIELLEHVVAVEAVVLPESHPNRLASQRELARAYAANGRIKEAIELLEHVVAVQKIVLSEDHPSRKRSIEWLQYCYDRLEEVSDSGESSGWETVDEM
jgi:tetratricopeptide (TPR) repeat protein